MTLILLFLSSSEGATLPSVVTGSVSSFSSTDAVVGGQITGLGSSPITARGIQFNTVPFPDRSTEEGGTFGVGSFTEALSALIANTQYYYRAYATTADGTAYGAWNSFTTLPDQYRIEIEGIDRTAEVLNKTLTINDELNDKQNTCTFSIIDRTNSGLPENDDEIVITLNDGSILFSGYILSQKLQSKRSNGTVRADITCIDQVRLLDGNLVNKSYTNQTDAEIINDIINTYCAGLGITTTNVVEGVTIDQINFNYVQPSQAIRRIADLTGRNWYIDYEKDVHYFPLTTNPAPFDIDDASVNYFDLSISKDSSQIKNRVYVRGGTRLSDPTIYEEAGDGVKKSFVLPDKPHEVTVRVNGIEQTLGIKNVNPSGFQWYLNFQEKYIEQDEAEPILDPSDTLQVEYSYDIPILVAVEDTDSIIEFGQKEFIIFDKTILTSQAARDRAIAELTDYANNIVEGGFSTFENGFRSGQYINIDLTDYGVSADYIVQKVVAKSFGAGHFQYNVSIASSKTMGIIRFLIEMLEANNRTVEVSDDEVVDNLLSVADSLLSDSIQDSLVIDSAGAYATWASDSLQTLPSTIAKWDLFQWG